METNSKEIKLPIKKHLCVAFPNICNCKLEERRCSIRRKAIASTRDKKQSNHKIAYCGTCTVSLT